jgi:two-component system, chemotaxis family, protein-glutamate methylesterase/glutaminase
MAKTRVLVVEDSPTVRELLAEVLNSDPDIDLVGVAANGKEGIELCTTHRPDVVTMDMMMPLMSGLAATEHIMAYVPTPILVVSSSFNRGELFKMYDALVAGAVDVLEKPSGDDPPGEWERRFLQAVKIVSRIRVITHIKARVADRSPQVNAVPAPRPVPVAVAAIGASTGGPGAIVELLRGLPANLGVPVLFVLHINPQFGHAFADWLDAQTEWRVRFARDGEPVSTATGRVVMAPPGRHLLVKGGRFVLDDGPERYSCRPSVDVLFESLAAEYGPATVAALLTGMGRDGAGGLLAIRKSGGSTIAQDEATSVVYGMPREAVQIGAAASVLPINDIASAMAATVRAGGRK